MLTYDKDKGIIKCGCYPRKKVYNKNLIEALNEKTDELKENGYVFYNGTYYFGINLYDLDFEIYVDLEDMPNNYLPERYDSGEILKRYVEYDGDNSYVPVKNPKALKDIIWFKADSLEFKVIRETEEGYVCITDEIIDSHDFDKAFFEKWWSETDNPENIPWDDFSSRSLLNWVNTDMKNVIQLFERNLEDYIIPQGTDGGEYLFVLPDFKDKEEKTTYHISDYAKLRSNCYDHGFNDGLCWTTRINTKNTEEFSAYCLDVDGTLAEPGIEQRMGIILKTVFDKKHVRVKDVKDRKGKGEPASLLKKTEELYYDENGNSKIMVSGFWDWDKIKEESERIFTSRITEEISYSPGYNLIRIRPCAENEKTVRYNKRYSCAQVDYTLSVALGDDANAGLEFIEHHKDARVYLEKENPDLTVPCVPSSIPNAKIIDFQKKDGLLILNLQLLADRCPFCGNYVNGGQFLSARCDFCRSDLDHGQAERAEWRTGKIWRVKYSLKYKMSVLARELKRLDYPFDIVMLGSLAGETYTPEEMKKILSKMNIPAWIERHRKSGIHSLHGNKITVFFSDYGRLIVRSADSEDLEHSSKSHIDSLLYSKVYYMPVFVMDGHLLYNPSIDYECNSLSECCFSGFLGDDADEKQVKFISGVFERCDSILEEKILDLKQLASAGYFAEYKESRSRIADSQRKNDTNFIHADEDGILRYACARSDDGVFIIADDVRVIGEKLTSEEAGILPTNQMDLYGKYRTSMSTLLTNSKTITIKMSDAVECIEPNGLDFSLDDMRMIESINISKSVKTLKKHTMSGSVKIKELYLSDTLEQIEDEPFFQSPEVIYYSGTRKQFESIICGKLAYSGISIVHASDEVFEYENPQGKEN